MKAQQSSDDVKILSTKAEIERLRKFWVSQNRHRDADLDYYLFIVELFPEVIRPHVIVLYRDGQPKAIAAGRLEERPLVARVGYWRIQTRKLRTLTIIHHGMVGDIDADDSKAIVTSIIELLRRGEADLARFETLDVPSQLYACATNIPHFAFSDQFTNPELHYGRALNYGAKSLIDSLSSNTRHNFRRSGKRLLEASPRGIRVELFNEVATVEHLMRDVETVAKKSYQRGLGVGFISSDRTQRRLEFEARKGWLRGYVLYLNDVPAAFWIGSLYKNTFHSDFIGYDPLYAKSSPGMYLVIKVLNELAGLPEERKASYVDFGGGEGLWKATLSDTSSYRTSAYIFAPTFAGFFLNFFWSAPSAINRLAKTILGRGDLLMRAKKMLRAKYNQGKSN